MCYDRTHTQINFLIIQAWKFGLPRLLTVTPAVYPRLVLNKETSYFLPRQI